MSIIVPPGGFAGFSQMTPASRASLFRGSRGPSRRRAATRKRRKVRASGKKRRSNGKRKLKFGSPAWQKKYKVGRFRK
jgi:hypothetical protein